MYLIDLETGWARHIIGGDSLTVDEALDLLGLTTDSEDQVVRCSKENEDTCDEYYEAWLQNLDTISDSGANDVYYTIKSEYADNWGPEAKEDTNVSLATIADLADEWNMSLEEILEQVEIVEEED